MLFFYIYIYIYIKQDYLFNASIFQIFFGRPFHKMLSEDFFFLMETSDPSFPDTFIGADPWLLLCMLSVVQTVNLASPMFMWPLASQLYPVP